MGPGAGEPLDVVSQPPMLQFVFVVLVSVFDTVQPARTAARRASKVTLGPAPR